MTCGVSIPINSTGCGRSWLSNTSKADARRSLRFPKDWATVSNSRLHGYGLPSQTRTLPGRATRPHGVQGVLDRARRQVGGLLGGEVRLQPRLHPARHRLLGQHRDGLSPIGSARSSGDRRTHVAHGVPDTQWGAGHLGASAARPVVHPDLADPPARIRRPDDGLGRIARPLVQDAQPEQVFPARGPHRSQITRGVRRSGAGSAPSVRGSPARRCQGCAPRLTGIRRAQHQVPVTGDDRVDHPGSCRGSRLASASITATIGARAASSPAWQAAP